MVAETILAQNVEAAGKPLFAKVEQTMAGLDRSEAGGGPGGRPSVSGGSRGFGLDAAAVRTHTQALRTLAENLNSLDGPSGIADART